MTNLSDGAPYLSALGLLPVSPKAALGVGDGEAAQEVGGDIQNLHADLAIARDVLAVPFAEARADNQGPTPLSRGDKI